MTLSTEVRTQYWGRKISAMQVIPTIQLSVTNADAAIIKEVNVAGAQKASETKYQ